MSARDERIFLYAPGKYRSVNGGPFSGHFSEVYGVTNRAVFVFRAITSFVYRRVRYLHARFVTY